MANQFKTTTASNLAEDNYIPGNKPKLAHQIPYGSDQCELCGGRYGRYLTTECPGYEISSAVADAVGYKLLDYLDGFWIDPRKPRVLPKPEPILNKVGSYQGIELYGDMTVAPEYRKLVDQSERSLKGSA